MPLPPKGTQDSRQLYYKCDESKTLTTKRPGFDLSCHFQSTFITLNDYQLVIYHFVGKTKKIMYCSFFVHVTYVKYSTREPMFYFYVPPFEKGGAYFIAHVGRYVGRSVGRCVGIP